MDIYGYSSELKREKHPLDRQKAMEHWVVALSRMKRGDGQDLLVPPGGPGTSGGY